MLEVILEDLKNQKEVRKNLIQMKELLKDEETRKELSELSAGNSIFLEFFHLYQVFADLFLILQIF